MFICPFTQPRNNFFPYCFTCPYMRYRFESILRLSQVECGAFCPYCSGHCHKEIGHTGRHKCGYCETMWGKKDSSENFSETYSERCGASCPKCSGNCDQVLGHLGPHTCGSCEREW